MLKRVEMFFMSLNLPAIPVVQYNSGSEILIVKLNQGEIKKSRKLSLPTLS